MFLRAAAEAASWADRGWDPTASVNVSPAHLATLRELGIRIAIDDFGTGCSSLSAVASLPADVLKVDRTLVAVRSPVSVSVAEAVVAAAAALGTALGMHVVAEGVETPQRLDLVRRAGCGFVQGCLFSRPVRADALHGCSPPGRGGRACAGRGPERRAPAPFPGPCAWVLQP